MAFDSHLRQQRPGAAPASPLIRPAELRRLMDSTTDAVILDVRWSLQGSDFEAFAEGHIPGAVFVDLDTELTAPPGLGGRHPLPEAQVVQNLLCRAGIDADTSVVVCGQRDVSMAARAWWVLRWAGLTDVRVLDGGVDAWRAEGLPLETGPDAPPGDGTARVRTGRMRMPTVDADGAAALGRDADGVLLDARAPERYRGDVEPVDPVAGHIPGAANLPLGAVHLPDGRLRDPAALRETFASVGVCDGAPVAASCGSGVTACALILAGAVAGYRFSLYPGSYSGWCALGRDVETG